jgi:tRNA U34 2-thiouridine synthase MnmA/TrmU
VKVRSTSDPRKGAVLAGNRCVFPDGIAGVAPGQSAVFYDEAAEKILCGGIISKE